MRSDQAVLSGWELVSRDSSAEVFGTFPIVKLPCCIGRGKNADIRLPNATVSTRHALIQPQDDRLVVEDLDSRNGTFVNGRRIKGSFPIEIGDLLQFGNMPLELQNVAVTRTNVTCVAGGNEDLALAMSRFNEIFEENALHPHFQPIVTASGHKTVAYEVLSRSTLFGLTLPKTMFDAAERLNRSSELSRFMRELALVQPLVDSEHLYLNTHPSEIEDLPELVRSLRRLRKLHPRQRITIEIHESAVADIATLKMIRLVLNDLRMELAYDDFGAGQARLEELIEAGPDVLKFDMKMIRGIDRAPKPKRQMVESLVHMTRDLGIRPLAEGVETEEEADVCQQLGFELFQGFLFGLPIARRATDPAPNNFARLPAGVNC
jgi:EAL domain-containing protein (putative c-di-GMP-specific phosphodiesterase class I)